ncbi:Serine-threonine kinase 19 protein [Rutstroemia sp. NJR-2017a WRK4]|nr:Serine-threonine kinase 19 protein [Rutstroemia sp. NJR-2017a WRK4]
MSLYRSAALSSRIKKTKPASLRRSSSSPFASLPKRKPTQRSKSIPEPTEDEDEEDFLDERLDDIGLVRTLATDLTLRDVAQAIQYIRGKMWTKLPDQRSGMNSTRIAEVLNFRKFLPPIVTVSHVQALLTSPTTVEREIAELIQGGAIRKVVVDSRGNLGEVLILMKDLETMVEKSNLDRNLKEEFLKLLRDHPTALKFPRSQLSEESAKAFVYAGFLTLSASHYTTTDHFSRPGDGSKGTLTSLNSISRAASGSLAAVGGEGALHAAGGSGGGARLAGHGDFSLSLPGTGQFLKLLSGARSHFASLLAKSKYRETPESLLRQRWDGGIEGNDVASAAKRSRGEFAGVLPGKTSKWKRHFGLSFEWVLEECVGAGLVEVFNTRSIGRGVRVL